MDDPNGQSTSVKSDNYLCCDPNGQSIGVKGDINPNHAGSYTCIMRLASQLDEFTSSSSSSPSSTTNKLSSQATSSKSNNTKSISSSGTRASPYISVETDQSVTLIKAYDDHTVVMKVPRTKTLSDEEAAGGETGHETKIETSDASNGVGIHGNASLDATSTLKGGENKVHSTAD
jgi:hypothetical protein